MGREREDENGRRKEVGRVESGRLVWTGESVKELGGGGDMRRGRKGEGRWEGKEETREKEKREEKKRGEKNVLKLLPWQIPHQLF